MKTLIVLGNGKSLKDIDLRALNCEDCFALNGAFLKFEELDFYPKYYGMFIMGPQKWSTLTIENFIKESYSKIDKFFTSGIQHQMDIISFPKIIPIRSKFPSHINFDMSKFSLPLSVEISLALHKIPENSYDKFSKFIMTLKKEELVKLTKSGLIKKFQGMELNENDYIRLPRYNTTWIPPNSFEDFIFSGGNAGVIACLLGYLMGYKKIILLGVDMNWVADDKIVNTNETYWFSDYFGATQYDLKDFCSLCTPKSINEMHKKAWINLSEMIEKNNLPLEIVNCSEKSKLDIFRRSTLDKEI